MKLPLRVWAGTALILFGIAVFVALDEVSFVPGTLVVIIGAVTALGPGAAAAIQSKLNDAQGDERVAKARKLFWRVCLVALLASLAAIVGVVIGYATVGPMGGLVFGAGLLVVLISLMVVSSYWFFLRFTVIRAANKVNR